MFKYFPKAVINCNVLSLTQLEMTDEYVQGCFHLIYGTLKSFKREVYRINKHPAYG